MINLDISSIPADLQSQIRLGLDALRQFQSTGNPETLLQSRSSFETVVNSPLFAQVTQYLQLDILNQLATIWIENYKISREYSNLTNAINIQKSIVQRSLGENIKLPGYLCNLSASLIYDYMATHKAEKLDESISFVNQAILLTQHDDPELDLPFAFNLLGAALNHRYQETNKIEDLDSSIEVSIKCAKMISNGHPYLDYCGILNNIGSALSHRYERLGHLADIERAINTWKTARKNVGDNPYIKYLIEGNLGTGFYKLSLRTGKLTDLEESIQSYYSALNIGLNHIFKATYLAGLSTALRGYFLRTKNFESLNKSIETIKQAIYNSDTEKFIYSYSLQSWLIVCC